MGSVGSRTATLRRPLAPTSCARRLLPAVLVALGCATPTEPADAIVRPFRIRVVDAATGRGVPLVELETVHNAVYVTDSAGVAAIVEPGLLGEETFFHVRSHGYELAPDGFGYRGVRPVLRPGGSLTVELRRLNVAERLYRVTGGGIYRDSSLLGDAVPLAEPLLNGRVLGQDSVVAAVYRGRLHWFWGDTNRVAYPLGNFSTSGATSELPANGGLDPAVGVDLEYFVDRDGFSRKMCPLEGPGLVWIDGLMVLELDGAERLLCRYARMKDLGTRLEQGLAVWNDDREAFEKLVEHPLDAPLFPRGHPVRAGVDGEEWLYFPDPYPSVRVRATADDVLDLARYEAYTCLREGERWNERRPPLEWDDSGRLVWGWKRNTDRVTAERWRRLVRRDRVRPQEGWLQLTDVESGNAVDAHGGSVYWNEHRGKWVMIFLEVGGRSYLGEVWYAEADELAGPWRDARRIVTHDDYSFYNVKHHPYFDDGRYLYFEGTYTSMFSGSAVETPRYDYNQIMYRLDLDDPLLTSAQSR